MRKYLAGGLNKGEQGKEPAPTIDDAEEKDDAFLMPTGALMIFGGSTIYDSKRRQKLTRREVYMTKPAVRVFLRWSESAITFDRTDHLKSVPQLGRYPLMVNPIIGTKRLTKVLIDGGSGLNIMYAETLDAMGIDQSRIHRTGAPFHRIVPRSRPCHLGRSICLSPSEI